jgi:hypothetical protein
MPLLQLIATKNLTGGGAPICEGHTKLELAFDVVSAAVSGQLLVAFPACPVMSFVHHVMRLLDLFVVGAQLLSTCQKPQRVNQTLSLHCHDDLIYVTRSHVSLPGRPSHGACHTGLPASSI